MFNQSIYGDLTTIGRKSGKPHTVELTYAIEDTNLYLLAHKRTDGTSTDWYHNLEVNPECTLATPNKTFKAKVVSLEENSEIENKIRELFKTKGGNSHYNAWYKDTSRIPVILEIID